MTPYESFYMPIALCITLKSSLSWIDWFLVRFLESIWYSAGISDFSFTIAENVVISSVEFSKSETSFSATTSHTIQHCQLMRFLWYNWNWRHQCCQHEIFNSEKYSINQMWLLRQSQSEDEREKSSIYDDVKRWVRKRVCWGERRQNGTRKLE